MEAETRTLETRSLYLHLEPLDEALTVVMPGMCPAEEDRIMTMEGH
jgi:hypothetical protein